MNIKEEVDRMVGIARTEPVLTDVQRHHALARVCRNDSWAMFALEAEVRTLKAALAEALAWAKPFNADDFPPDSRSELMPTVTRRAGVDRAARLAELEKLVR